MICLCSDLPFPFNSACTEKDSQFPTGCILYAPRSVDFGQVPSRKVLERWQDVSPLALWWRWHLPHGSQSCRTNPDADISGFWALSLDCQVQNGSGSPLVHIPRSHHWLLFISSAFPFPIKPNPGWTASLWSTWRGLCFLTWALYRIIQFLRWSLQKCRLCGKHLITFL